MRRTIRRRSRAGLEGTPAGIPPAMPGSVASGAPIFEACKPTRIEYPLVFLTFVTKIGAIILPKETPYVLILEQRNGQLRRRKRKILRGCRRELASLCFD